jgi:hypothetical protein
MDHMSLVEFLRERLGEAELDAQAAYDGDGYREWDIPCTGVVQVAGGDLDGLVVAPRNAAIHIALNDPAYVLADIAAKRAILDEHAPRELMVMGDDPGFGVAASPGSDRNGTPSPASSSSRAFSMCVTSRSTSTRACSSRRETHRRSGQMIGRASSPTCTSTPRSSKVTASQRRSASRRGWTPPHSGRRRHE